MLVLNLIAEKKSYGYDIMLHFKEAGKGLFDMKEGTLYPLLYRLEDEGLIVSEKIISAENKREKKYYIITQSGKNLIADLSSYWHEFSQCIDRLMKSTKEEEEKNEL